MTKNFGYVWAPLSKKTSRKVASRRRYTSSKPPTWGSKKSFKSKGKTKQKFSQFKKLNTSKLHRDGPMSRSAFKFPRNGPFFKLGKTKELIAPQNYVFNNTYRLNAGIGTQAMIGWSGSSGGGAVTVFPSMFGVIDLKNIFLLANRNTTGDATNSPVVPTGAQVTTKIYIKKAVLETMYTNQTNDVVHMDIYDVMARRDLNDNAPQYANPGYAWKTGCIDAGTAGAYQIIGATPFTIPGFTEFWKIEKITHVELHTGGHHTHVNNYNPCKMISNEILANTSTTLGAIGHLTRATCAVIHGYPVNDQSTQTQISTLSVTVDMLWKNSYEFYQVQDNQAMITYTNNLPTSFTNNPSFISDTQGTQVTAEIQA